MTPARFDHGSQVRTDGLKQSAAGFFELPFGAKRNAGGLRPSTMGLSVVVYLRGRFRLVFTSLGLGCIDIVT